MHPGDVLRGDGVVARTSATGAAIQDAEVARAAGMKAPVVPNVVHFAHLSELLLEHFGAHWLTGGAIDLRYVAPLHAGDTLRPGVRIAALDAGPEGTRVRFEAWCENGDGETLAMGGGECLLPPGVEV